MEQVWSFPFQSSIFPHRTHGAKGRQGVYLDGLIGTTVFQRAHGSFLNGLSNKYICLFVGALW